MNDRVKFVLYDRLGSEVPLHETYFRLIACKTILGKLRDIYDKYRDQFRNINELECDLSAINNIYREIRLSIHQLNVNSFGHFDNRHDAFVAGEKVAITFNTLVQTLLHIKNSVLEHCHLTPPPMFEELIRNL